jgi:hypothetical protein
MVAQACADAHNVDALLRGEAVDQLRVVRLTAVVSEDNHLRLVLLDGPAHSDAENLDQNGNRPAYEAGQG